MRIALKPVADSPTADTTSTHKSSGGSFLDILIQGTQDAVQPTKGSSAPKQSDTDSSTKNAPDDSQPNESSSQTVQATQSTSAPAATSRVQTAQAGNSASTQQSGQTADGNSQSDAATNQSSGTQSLNNLLMLMNLAAASNNATAVSSAPAQTTTSSSNQVAPSGKQAGTTKGTQGKQDASAAASLGTTALQQAMITLPQTVTIPETVPSSSDAVAASTSTPVTQSSADQAGSQIASTAALAAEDAAQGAAQNTINQTQPQAASDQAPAGQEQQSASPSSASAAASRFQHDLAAFTATSAKTAAPDLSADAGSVTQSSDQKPAKTSDQAAANTFFSAALQQNSDGTNQTTAKVIPFKTSATNLGSNSNLPNTTPASSTTSTSTSVAANAISATTAFKSSSQGSSNSSSRDDQSNNDPAANAQVAVVRTADASTTTQTAALGTFAATHAAAQPASTTSTADTTAVHTSPSRNLSAEPANTSLPSASSAINSARVIQNMNESEMRVGLRSTEFGDISIRTMVTQQQMQTQISVDHSELVSALTAHIPAVQAKLGADYGLHASIEVSQGGASFSDSQGQSSQRDYKPFTTSTQLDSAAPLTENDGLSTRSTLAAAAVVEGSRLDIRA